MEIRDLLALLTLGGLGVDGLFTVELHLSGRWLSMIRLALRVNLSRIL